MDCYTGFAARASKYKNPINDVGVSVVYGIDEPKVLEHAGVYNRTADGLAGFLKFVEYVNA